MFEATDVFEAVEVLTPGSALEAVCCEEVDDEAAASDAEEVPEGTFSFWAVFNTELDDKPFISRNSSTLIS